ncbi:MAG: ATP-binding cassette domain-containing protein [Tenericutes bacterium]|nr:ATP-binding cassette domain-containing protein [Mycoplasmatota bacterium]
MMKEEYLLSIKNVSKSFSGVTVLNKVNLNVRKGSIHALMGENGAGKSTMMKCLFGIYKQDEGEFILDGKKVNFTDPKHALENGISMVHQELNQVLQRNVLDNIWLGRYPRKNFLVDEREMLRKTKALFKSLGIDVNPNAEMGSLSVSQRQMVEIAKAVSYNAKVIVLDEPTSSLTENEVDKLFEIMRSLKDKGVGLIYISHKMEEIFEITDEVTVLRDGNLIGMDRTKNLTMDIIINMMVGRTLTQRFPDLPETHGEVNLIVNNLSTKYKPKVEDVSFTLHKGEILGIGGLVGSRRTELVEAIFGARTMETGEIILDGETIDVRHPVDAIKHKFALITEERRRTGIYPVANIRFNTTIANIHAYRNKVGILQERRLIEDTDKQIKDMRIKTPHQQELIRALSGGNQQKVIIGRWLLTDPNILIMDEPTRGIDVGAKFEIYQLMIQLIERGKSIIMVSSEMPELLGVTHRIAVMSNGRLAGIVDTKKTSQEEIFKLSAKYL